MIEINVRIKIDTNDPREAYLQAMSTLSFSGHLFDVSDYWLANGKPIPKCIAQSIKEPINFIEQCGRAIEHDPGLQPLLEDLQAELTHCVSPMEAFNELILDGLPKDMEVVAEVNATAMKEWAEARDLDYRQIAMVEPTVPRLNVLPNAGGPRDIDEEISNLFECIRNSSEPFRKLDFDVGYADRMGDLSETTGSHAIDVDIPMDSTDLEIAELLAQTIPGNRIGRYFEIMGELPVFEEEPMHASDGTYFNVAVWKWVEPFSVPA